MRLNTVVITLSWSFDFYCDGGGLFGIFFIRPEDREKKLKIDFNCSGENSDCCAMMCYLFLRFVYLRFGFKESFGSFFFLTFDLGGALGRFSFFESSFARVKLDCTNFERFLYLLFGVFTLVTGKSRIGLKGWMGRALDGAEQLTV